MIEFNIWSARREIPALSARQAPQEKPGSTGPTGPTGNVGPPGTGILTGDGSPNGRIAANPGAIYVQLDPNTGTIVLWVKTVGFSIDTGWNVYPPE